MNPTHTLDRPAAHRTPLAPASAPDLDDLRQAIDAVDQELVALIASRCHLARSAGEQKRAAGLPLLDPGQEAAVVRRVAVRARDEGLDEETLRQVFWCLIDLSRRMQAENGR